MGIAWLGGFGAVCAMAVVPAAAASPASPPPAPAVAQELTVGDLGMGAQTVSGARGLAEVYFPPPATKLAPVGSFVRVFFAHTRDPANGSTMLVSVNSQPLDVVHLSPGTAGGGVVDVPVPTNALDERQPNRLQVRFDLRTQSSAPPDLFGRLAAQTMMHYLFVRRPGPPGLEDYPHSLLAAGDPNPALGVVLPSSPGPEELSCALRLMGDLGRRAGVRRVRPRVVASDQLSWLSQDRTGALLMGRLDRLPGAGRVLQSAGWKQAEAGWTAPDGRVLRPDDGLVLSAISPWDGRSPLLLVGGSTDTGVARAVATLTSTDDLPLAGPYAVVSDAPAGPGVPVASTAPLRLTMLDLHDLSDLAPGRYRSSQGFEAPAVDPGDTAVVDLAVRGLGGAAASAAVEVAINGSPVTPGGLQALQAGQLQVPFPGALLRAGRNVLTVDLRVDRPARPDATGAGQPPSGSGAWSGDDAAAATISLPAGGPRSADLRLLPYPLADSPDRQLWVLLTDADAPTLTAAAQAMVALGARATGPLPALRAELANRRGASWDQGSLLVVGIPRSAGPLDQVASALPVPITASANLVAAGVPASPARGILQEATLAGSPDRQVVWVAATSPDQLSAAAGALADPALSGRAVMVDANGALSPLRGRTAIGARGGAGGVGTGTALVALTALLLVGALVLDLLRPRRTRA